MSHPRRNVLQNCTNWPRNYLDHLDHVFGGKAVKLFSPDNQEAPFIKAVQKYANENIASIKLAFKTPYVESIKSDLQMRYAPWAQYVFDLC